MLNFLIISNNAGMNDSRDDDRDEGTDQTNEIACRMCASRDMSTLNFIANWLNVALKFPINVNFFDTVNVNIRFDRQLRWMGAECSKGHGSTDNTSDRTYDRRD